MSKNAEMFIWCLPLMGIIACLGYLGSVWLRFMVTGSLEIIKTIGGIM